MKTENLLYTNKYSLLKTNKNSNISFGNNFCIGMFKTQKGDTFIKYDILDRIYHFKLTDDLKINTIEKMVENVEKTITGHFVRFGKHDYFVPYILKKAPKIKKDYYTVERGNTKTRRTKETRQARDVFQNHTGNKIKINEIMSINYLQKPFSNFANNVIKTAFSYFDKKENNLYLFFPSKNKMEVVNNTGFIETINLNV